MIDFLIKSEEDITLLTCKKCAIDTWVELLESGCRFIQDRTSLIREINKNSRVYEITKLVAETEEDDVFFIFASDDRKHLEDRLVIVNECVLETMEDEVELLDEERFFDSEYCDECLSVEEIMMDKELSYEEALRTAYRCGREAALYEIAEEIESKIFE